MARLLSRDSPGVWVLLQSDSHANETDHHVTLMILFAALALRPA